MISFQSPAILWQACWLCCFRIVSANMHSVVSFTFRVAKKKKRKKEAVLQGGNKAQPQNCIIFLQHQILLKMFSHKRKLWHQSPMFAFFAINICPCETWRQFGHCKITCCFHSHLSCCSKMLACLWQQMSAVCFQPIFCTTRYLQVQLLWQHSHNTSSSSCKWPLSKYRPACHFWRVAGKKSYWSFWVLAEADSCTVEGPTSLGRSWAVTVRVRGRGGCWLGGRDKLFQSLMVLGGKAVVSVVCSTGDLFEVKLLSSSGSGWYSGR